MKWPKVNFAVKKVSAYEKGQSMCKDVYIRAYKVGGVEVLGRDLIQ